MKPLAGRRILVTRPRAQAAGLCDPLAALGAQPILFPTIEIAPIADTSRLDQAIRQLADYQWVIFTSVNGVAAFWERLSAVGRDPRVLDGIRVAAIGPATARALSAHHVDTHFVPEEYVAEAIVEGIGDVLGQRVLLPRADIAREALAAALERRGAVVDAIAAYHTLPAAADPRGLAELRRGVDAISFTSSSAVHNFVLLAGRDTGDARVACIGPVTAGAARELGLRIDVVAAEYTMQGLVTALAAYFQEMPTHREGQSAHP
jgi:uroporphyrinogen-III synthase